MNILHELNEKQREAVITQKWSTPRYRRSRYGENTSHHTSHRVSDSRTRHQCGEHPCDHLYQQSRARDAGTRQQRDRRTARFQHQS